MIADLAKAVELLDEFITAIDRYDASDFYEPRKTAADAVKLMQPGIERIAASVEPGVHHHFPPGSRQFPRWRNVALRIKGILAKDEEIAAIVGPAGPSLTASQLHPSVWHVAADLWAGQHYREALQAAATQVDLMLQAKLGRGDVTGKPLFLEAFSTDEPKPGRPRLRFADYDRGSDDWRSAHEGARHLGAACAMLIRNLSTHRLEQLGEQLSLERLATLSLVARLIDDADVEQASI